MTGKQATIAFAALFGPPAILFGWMFGADGLMLYALSAIWIGAVASRLARGMKEEGHG